ncbi:PP2C family serine/threonine-protein phosphatase [Aspergillus undulatus]|uniref:PP2C family serine/threonine-protein phosphatase n=1 Tax=Aspergillus undulatus TaxID=1810928 RepID=UPI003CCC9992
MDDPTSDTPGSNILELHAVGGTSAQGSRPGQEDEYVILTSEDLPSEIKDTHAFFAVLDGHGGDIVSKHAKEHIPKLVFDSAQFKSGEYEQALQEAINQEDELLKSEFHKGHNNFALAGSTVSIALVDLRKGLLVVGNVGDSHIFLAERDAENGELKSVLRLTESHKPEKAEEKKRIEQAGGQIHEQHAITRVGSLNMSRAFGDLQYKKPLISLMTNQTDAQESATTNSTDRTQRDDLITVQMSSQRRELGKEQQYFLALTTDGITNVANDETVMRTMADSFNEGNSADQVAAKLVNQATATPQSDNSTCIAVFLNGVAARPNLQKREGAGPAD